jgi:hypothetical protein
MSGSVVRHALLAACGGLVVSLLTAFPAQAAPPPSDEIEDAVRLSQLPFRSAVDTSEATREAADGDCVGGASVWYRFRPQFTGRVRAATVGSDYDTVLAVFRGTRDNRRVVACNDDFYDLQSALRVKVKSGRTYWFALSSCCGSRSDVGGSAVLNIYRPRPAGITATVSSVETGATSGRLYVDGTVQCSTPSYAEVNLRVSQRLASGAVARASDTVFPGDCGAGPGDATWSLSLDSETGWAFAPGTATVTMDGFAYDGFRTAFIPEQTFNAAVGTDPNRLGRPSSKGRAARPALAKAG